MDTDWIKCCDCLEGMKAIPDGTVDAIITDPPFGTTCNFWNKRVDLDAMWSEFKRVTKKNAAICIFSQLPFAVDVINANRKMFRYEWIWHKSLPVGFLNANKMPLRAHENVLVFYRHLPTYNPQYSWSKPYKKKSTDDPNRDAVYAGKHVTETVNESGRRYPLDILRYGNPLKGFCSTGEDTGHSCQKPTALMEYLIRTYTNEGETVLDAFMGSGTTAVAAVNTGRHYIGFEKHQPYVDMCNRRIEEARRARDERLF